MLSFNKYYYHRDKLIDDGPYHRVEDLKVITPNIHNLNLTIEMKSKYLTFINNCKGYMF